MEDNLFEDEYEGQSGLLCDVCNTKQPSTSHRFMNDVLVWVCDKCLETAEKCE